MKTTRKQAKLFLKIANWVDPYALCSFDEAEYMQSLMSNTFEENCDDLFTWICEGYTTKELLESKDLIKLIAELYAEKNNKVTESPNAKYEYWENVASDYIDVLIDDKGNDFPDLTEAERIDLEKEVAENILNDDETWNTIDESINYYIWHSDIVKENSVVEWCPQCEQEVKIKAIKCKPQECPNCKALIRACSLCNQDTCDCSKCKGDE